MRKTRPLVDSAFWSKGEFRLGEADRSRYGPSSLDRCPPAHRRRWWAPLARSQNGFSAKPVRPQAPIGFTADLSKKGSG